MVSNLILFVFWQPREMPYSWLTIVIIIVKTNVAAKLGWMLGNKICNLIETSKNFAVTFELPRCVLLDTK